LVLTILLCVGPLVAQAQLPARSSAPESQASSLAPMLDEVAVTATRGAKTAFDTPYMVQSISAEDIQLRQLSRNLPDALKETPGVMVQKTAYGQGSPYIRGFTGFRTLMLVDGIRLNNSVFRDGPVQYWSLVDPLSVDHLEVVKGSSSVLYGSDAIGGTVNAITQSRQEYGEGFLWDRQASYRYASADNSHIGRAAASGSVDRQFGFQVGVSVKDFGDLRAGSPTGDQSHTGYRENFADFKGEYFLDADSKLILAYQRADQDDVWRTHRTIYGESWHGTTVGTDKEHLYNLNRDLGYLQYRAKRVENFVEAVTASISFQRLSEEMPRIFADNTSQQQGFDVDTLGAWFQLESPSPIGRWTYGAEFYHDSVDTYSRKYNADGSLKSVGIQGPFADDATYDLLGVFVQDDIPLGERFNLILGTRYSYVAADSDKVEPTDGTRGSLSKSWDSVVGSGRLLYRADEADHWHLFAGASQGFRAPNLSDMTRKDIVRSGEVETLATNLKPEQYISSEIGVKARYKDWSAEIAYYYTDIKDMIVRQPTGNIIGGKPEVTKANAGAGYLHGAELSAKYQFCSQWTASGWFTWMYGEVGQYPDSTTRVTDEPIGRLMPATGNLGLHWEHPKGKFWAEAVTTLTARQDELSTSDRMDTDRIPPDGTPGYAIFIIRGGWRITPNVSLSVAAENLTDKDYRVHGSGVNEAGRNLIATLSARF